VADVFERFAPDPANIRAARLLVLASLAPMDDAEVAELLTTELSANAIQHARTPFTVGITHDDAGMLTVEVHDHASTLPVMAPYDPEAARGRGLLLVDAFSREWGVTMAPGDGKTVWFRL
jgi:anti-sigma regulatory factor (Ser/Thr protein kinase)